MPLFQITGSVGLIFFQINWKDLTTFSKFGITGHTFIKPVHLWGTLHLWGIYPYLDSTSMTIHKTIKSVKQNFIFITCLMFMTVTKNKISSLV